MKKVLRSLWSGAALVACLGLISSSQAQTTVPAPASAAAGAPNKSKSPTKDATKTDDGKPFKFVIPEEMQRKYPDVVELVRNSESIDNNEKQYWYDIMPSMTEEQIGRLRNILETERRQLEELNVKYQEEIKKLNRTHRQAALINPLYPSLRLETGTHLSGAYSATLDAAGQFLVTAGRDKTARVWRVSDGSLHRTLRVPIAHGSEGRLTAGAIHPRQPIVAVGGELSLAADSDMESVVYLLDRDTGEVRSQFPLPQHVWKLHFTADGRHLVIVLMNGQALTWRIADGVKVAELSGIRQMAFAKRWRDQAIIVTDDKVSLIDIRSDGSLAVRTSVPRSSMPAGDLAFEFSPDGRELLIADTTAKVWRAPTETLFVSGEAFRVSTAGVRSIPAMLWTEGGDVMLSYSHPLAGKSPLLRATLGGDTALVAEMLEQANHLLPSALGRTIVVNGEPRIDVIEKGTDRLNPLVARSSTYQDSEGAPEPVIRASKDGKRVEFGFSFHRLDPHVFDVKQRALVNGGDSSLSFARRPDAPGVALEFRNWRDHGELAFRLRSGDAKHAPPWKELGFEVESTALQANDASFVVGARWGVYRVNTAGKRLWFSESEATVAEVHITGDENLVVSTDARGVIEWRRFSDGELLLSFFAHADGKRWVTWTPSGFYDASQDGESLIGWHINRGATQAPDFFPIEMFRDQFRRPGVVSRILDTLDEAKAVALADAEEGRERKSDDVIKQLPPTLRLAEAPAKFTQPVVGIRVRPIAFANAPVYDYVVEVDGKAVAPLRSLRYLARDGSEELLLRLPPRDVKVEIRAKNRHGLGPALKLDMAWAGEANTVDTRVYGDRARAKPRLWILSVGVGTYQDRTLNRLYYAARDAEAFATALQFQKGRAYSDVRVEVITDQQATREHLLEKLQWLRLQVAPGDVAMLFLSGHGVALGAEGRYFFAPTDFDLTQIEKTGIADSQIRDALLDINNRGDGARAFLFVDTCHAGNAEQPAERRKARSSNADDLADQLRRNARNVYVFASSSGDEKSFEAPDYRQGAFTQALVEGVGPPTFKAAPYEDGVVLATSLFDYVARRVPAILKHERQNPTFIAPRGGVSRVVMASRE